MIIFDISEIAYRSAYIYRSLSTNDGKPTGHVFGTFRMLISLCKKLGGLSSDIYFALDSGPSWRYDVYAQYKNGGRVHDYTFDMDELVEGLKHVPGASVCSAPRCEADDIIYTLCKTKPGSKIVVSSDRDMWCLTDQTTKIFSMALKRFVNYDDLEEFSGVRNPEGVSWYKILRGDISDNVPSVITNKKAQAVVQAIASKFKTSDSVTSVKDFMKLVRRAKKDINPKIYEAINADKEGLNRNYKLVVLNTTDINCVKNESKDLKPLLDYFSRFSIKSIKEEDLVASGLVKAKQRQRSLF